MNLQVSLTLQEMLEAIEIYLDAKSGKALRAVEGSTVCFIDGEGDEIFPEEITVHLTKAE